MKQLDFSFGLESEGLEVGVKIDTTINELNEKITFDHNVSKGNSISYADFVEQLYAGMWSY